MKISVIGSGYVGLVAAACFSKMGNNVVCLDKNISKINDLKNGVVSIFEPGLSEIIKESIKKKNLSFTCNYDEALKDVEILFIAVGTPMCEDGSADLKYVLQVASSIGQNMKKPLIIVDKSTVPIGTSELVRSTIQKELDLRKEDISFDVVSNPEFLKEGTAINDFMSPDRIIIGTNNKDSILKIKELYSPFILNRDRLIVMDAVSAEMTKYAANAMLATKISFINEMANICELVGANINNVRIGIGSDTRIGYKFIYPGCGYGGSCFPKDIKALIKASSDKNYYPKLISAVDQVNNEQKNILSKKIINHFGDNLEGLIFGVWGLSFKPETDDIRQAPSINLIKKIVECGGQVNAYDPNAIDSAKKELSDLKIKFYNDKYSLLNKVDALILVTEWKEFRSPDFNKMKTLMNRAVIFDGRNQYDANFLKDIGFSYNQIGV
ncbi:MAG: UDP-glucose 6-dehydrogenase [Flavobacteriales bacterium]|nr:UDP-glucose 6-dehydrogenase [Flavobacteriales bacterium]